ncbi:MAG: patatin-like phospholipase family protein [Candidatus Goldiibacteriota bacterium]
MEQEILNKKCGLVLSIGAAKGLAHIGVIKSLTAAGIKFHNITGSSMGALVGACFAAHGNIKTAEKKILDIDLLQLAGLIDPKFKMLSKGLISGEKVKELLKQLIGDIEFKDLKIPLTVVAADINTAEEVVFDTGSVVDAVRASISMPGIFVPVAYKDSYLIDGASVNPLPVDKAKEKGADYIIVSNIVPSSINYRRNIQKIKLARENAVKKFFRRLLPEKNNVNDEMPDMFTVLMQAIHIMESGIIKAGGLLKEADLIITPDVGETEDLDFTIIRETIEKGSAAAEKELEKTGLTAVK